LLCFSRSALAEKLSVCLARADHRRSSFLAISAGTVELMVVSKRPERKDLARAKS
jgi:hypothetical protein